ncbi:MAG: UDP-galactopyranose mutase [Bacteroidota bacterium]
MDFSSFPYIVVGSGFFGAVMAERIANDLGEKVLVIEKRNHIGGNSYSRIDPESGIEYHVYGTHIFHTSNEKVWQYINRFTDFNSYHHQVLSTYQDKVYQLPINLETINSFYGLNLKPFEVKDFLAGEIAKSETSETPTNFEEMAISMMGEALYKAFFRGYTLKQWNKDPKLMPASVLKRLPFRTNYNESYYNSRWQGIPLKGYTHIFKGLLRNSKIELKLNCDFFDIKDQISPKSTLIYSGPLDRFYNYKYGRLEWRTLRFEKEVKKVEDFQGTAVMNYPELSVPFTRIHEPRHLHPERTYHTDRSLLIREYSEMDTGENPFYPINDARNQAVVKRYRAEAAKESNLIISGRLGDYKYYDMEATISRALELYENKIKDSYGKNRLERMEQ